MAPLEKLNWLFREKWHWKAMTTLNEIDVHVLEKSAVQKYDRELRL